MDLRETWMLVLLSDSGLPTGAFISSGGLESAVQSGVVRSRDDLETFVKGSLHNFVFSQLPFVIRAHGLVASWPIEAGDDEALVASLGTIDGELDELLACNHVARRASLSQGLAYATLLVEALSQGMARPSLAKTFKRSIRSGVNSFFL